jgi:hypothetical protein
MSSQETSAQDCSIAAGIYEKDKGMKANAGVTARRFHFPEKEYSNDLPQIISRSHL